MSSSDGGTSDDDCNIIDGDDDDEEWVREVRQLLIDVHEFEDLVRVIARDSGVDFTSRALQAMQVAAEQFMTQRFEQANRTAIYAGSDTVTPEDLRFTENILRDQFQRQPTQAHPRSTATADTRAEES